MFTKCPVVEMFSLTDGYIVGGKAVLRTSSFPPCVLPERHSVVVNKLALPTYSKYAGLGE